jgi:protein involved in polysaccharide export with SLBB domain
MVACCLAIPSFSQTLDEDFLASLPQDVRTQLLSEMNDKELANKEKNLKAPSTALSKKNLVSVEDDQKKSDKFGVEFFRTLQTTFMPINEPTFDPSYVLGVGDELVIQYTGQKNDILEFVINRDGTINLPEIGKIVISGLSLARVDELIKAKIKQAFIGVDVFTTLASIRDMQILVVGEAAYPGVYTLPGNASLLNVLAAAGGFNENASLRSLEIKRDGKTFSNIDLYQAFVYGDFSKINAPLRSGDTVFIKPSSFEVRIQGGVRRDAVYELLEGEGYAELLEFANGYKNTAKTDEIQLTRIANKKVNYDVLSDQALRTTKLLHEDVLTIQSIDTITVSIVGAVNRPGTYVLPEKASMLDLLDLAGNYKDQAYPFGGIYLTESAKEQERVSVERIRKDLIAFISSSPLKGDVVYDPSLLLAEYSSLEPIGRVSMDFAINKIRANKNKLLLQDRDEVIIPIFQNIVHVYGALENPGSFFFQSGTNIENYIELAGGKKANASDKIILYHPNGESEILEQKRLFGFNQSSNMIYPGSLIFIPREFELSAIETTNLYLPVVSNLAITLASIASLANNTK